MKHYGHVTVAPHSGMVRQHLWPLGLPDLCFSGGTEWNGMSGCVQSRLFIQFLHEFYLVVEDSKVLLVGDVSLYRIPVSMIKNRSW